MKILLVVKQKKNVDTFIGTIRALLARGHAVTLAVQEHGDARDQEYRDEIPSPDFTVARAPAQRTDAWAHVAPLIRSLRDVVHYQQPPLRGAIKLQERTIRKLREDLRVAGDHVTIAEGLRAIPAAQIDRLETVFDLAEQRLPSDALHEQFLRSHSPDVLLLSPVVHFGSAQADFVASARALGIPVGMLLHSWDNLSTKGCMHQRPDWMFVWNEQQRREAFELHGFPEDRVIVVGAPRFDGFFELRPRLSREEFHEPIGLDPHEPTLLYVCSSQLISSSERTFVERWLSMIRRSSGPIRNCNVIIRPHPDIPLLDGPDTSEELRWPAAKGLKCFRIRPFDDARAIVLRTSDRAQQGFFECIHHSAGVVGLNTSAELEAAIVGRPVYTVEAGDDAQGQRTTLHFHYLLEGYGGVVRVAQTLDEHVAQVAAGLSASGQDSRLRAFVGSFLRPRGLEHPVAPLLAEAIEQTFRTLVAGERQPTSSPDSPSMHDEARDAFEQIAAHAPKGSFAEQPTVDVSVPKYGFTLRVRVPNEPEAERRYRVEKSTVEWLRQHVGIGDVVYDIDAGIGLYALLAAKHHGAVVIAFEPGYAVFSELCDNLRLNGCDGSITALPLALADFEGLGELKYPTGLAGRQTHSLRSTGWRVKKAAADDRNFKQPVCAMPLDVVVQRFGLPMPTHLRASNPESTVCVLEGALGLLGSESLKSLLLTFSTEQRDAVVSRLAAPRWSVTSDLSLSRGRTQMLVTRQRR
jgi:FkbM family methyltransferase